MKKIFFAITLLCQILLTCMTSEVKAQEVRMNSLFSWLDEFSTHMTVGEVGVILESREDASKFYITCIKDMSDYVNNKTKDYVLYKDKLFLIYPYRNNYTSDNKFFENLLKKTLRDDLDSSGKDRASNIPPTTYDPMCWELKFTKDGVIKSNYSGKLPNWSYWGDRH